MGNKGPPYQFFSYNFYKRRTFPWNFLTFSFNSLVTLVYNFKVTPSSSPKLLNLNQDHPSKKVVLLVKSLKNWRYDNFSHRNARVTTLVTWPHLKYNLSHVINFFRDVVVRNYDVMTFILKYLYFKKNWSGQFCWHHQNCKQVY